jgi:parallel beta-helix repeat protein
MVSFHSCRTKVSRLPVWVLCVGLSVQALGHGATAHQPDLMISLAVLSHAVPGEPVVWVDDDFDPSTPGWGITHFDKIQDGIEAVNANGTVYVASGTYYEYLQIDKPLNLTGELNTSTVIQGVHQDTVVRVGPDGGGTAISGFTVQDSGPLWPDAGILVDIADQVSISDNIVKNNFIGVHLSDSSNDSVENNKIENNDCCGIGIYCWTESSQNILISRNDLNDNAGSGIIFGSNTYVTSSHHTIIDNDIRNNDDKGIHAERLKESLFEENVFVGNKFGGIRFENYALQNTIRGNFIYNDGTTGVYLFEHCGGNTIEDNSFSNNSNGLNLYRNCSNNTIHGNSFYNTAFDGIRVVDYCNWNIISNNNIQYSEWSSGIALRNVKYNEIVDNEIFYCDDSGIELGEASNHNTISRNHIHHNHWQGILLDRADHNIISENTFEDNNPYGVYMDPQKGASENNLIYHNNFIDLPSQAYDEFDNDWDQGYPMGGNYWEDYTGQDLNGDGIGDTPYLIKGGANQDNYPLMTPYYFQRLWADSYTLSASSGGTIQLTIDGGPDNAHRAYIILGGMTGTVPGTPLPGGRVILPINWDTFTNVLLHYLNSPFFQDFLGKLDQDGQAHAQLNFLSLHGLQGQSMYYASACNKPYDTVSNPIAIKIEN